jgi:hypothetical protein
MNAETKNEADNRFLRSWTVEVTVKGKDWVQIDRQDNNSQLRFCGAVLPFGPLGVKSVIMFD